VGWLGDDASMGSDDLDMWMWFLGFSLWCKTMTCGESRVRGLEGTGLAPPYPPPLDPLLDAW
jgi:hypothetical protein